MQLQLQLQMQMQMQMQMQHMHQMHMQHAIRPGGQTPGGMMGQMGGRGMGGGSGAEYASR
eukprot:998467-Amorphochlora_amoeboformis.AAC.1